VLPEIDAIGAANSTKSPLCDEIGQCCYSAKNGSKASFSTDVSLVERLWRRRAKKLPSGWLVPLGILPFRPRFSFVRS
jgi:hypothetical protein